MAFKVAPRESPCSMADGLPSMRICTLLLPRKDTLPSGSTATEGTLLSASAAVPFVLPTSDLTS
ncbi:hypothetical protein JaAD80_27335 [Janthinobacterium sp. AD80]|nr:hypothetical protein JaAD80_27335 [Janthinobacterium sp. AD80]